MHLLRGAMPKKKVALILCIITNHQKQKFQMFFSHVDVPNKHNCFGKHTLHAFFLLVDNIPSMVTQITRREKNTQTKIEYAYQNIIKNYE